MPDSQEFGIFLHFVPCFCYNDKYNSGEKDCPDIFV